MPETIFAMLIWVASTYGGPAVLPSFTSLQACEDTRLAVERAYEEMGKAFPTIFPIVGPNVRTRCIALPAR